jgi:rod shape-determining protein MreC
MATKHSRISARMLFTWFMLAGLILLFAPDFVTRRIQFTIVRIIQWPVHVVRSFRSSARADLTGDIGARIRPEPDDRYINLRNHLANTLASLKQEHEKVERLSGLRDRLPWKGVNFVMADVVFSSYGPQHQLIINRGSDDGLAAGQFVMSDQGIVGTISDLCADAARVRLITDPGSKMAVKIADLNVSAVLRGNGDGTLKIPMLPFKYKVKANDIVYAQKKPGFLNAPVVAGVVSSCRANRENPLLWDIEVRPACDLKTLHQVSVIVPDQAAYHE